ncbi:MAG: protein kinase, partial [Victivallales bacterium]|nr:protein kinase [Victivallales bacterium]
MSAENNQNSGQVKGNAAKTVVIPEDDRAEKGSSGKAPKTVVIPKEEIQAKDASGSAMKTAVISDAPIQPTDAPSESPCNQKTKRKASDTEARTIASIKKLKVRPKTTTPGTATRRNLMSILGDTFGAITSSFVTSDEVNKTNFFKTIKNDDNSSESEMIHEGDKDATSSLGSLESQYKIGAKIAEGGQGSIKKALDRLFQRVVAIKSLHDCVKNQDSVRSAFLNEARITAQLEHPSIVPIYGLYSDNAKGLHLAMKLIQGNDLRKHLDAIHEQYSELPKYQIRLRERKMLKQRLEFFLHVCDALEYVHSKHV